MPFYSQSQWRAAFAGYLGPKMKAHASEWAHKSLGFKSLPKKTKKDVLKKIISKHKK